MTTELRTCYFCKRQTTPGDFCCGCGVDICARCDNELSDAADIGAHMPEDHLDTDTYDDDDVDGDFEEDE